MQNAVLPTKSHRAPHERAFAARLWQALMFAPSDRHLRAARQQLQQSPAPIQLAVAHALLAASRGDQEPRPDQNPFL